MTDDPDQMDWRALAFAMGFLVLTIAIFRWL